MSDLAVLAWVAGALVVAVFMGWLTSWLNRRRTPAPAPAPVVDGPTSEWPVAAESAWDHGTDMKRLPDGYGAGLVPVPRQPVPRQRWVEPVTAEIVAERVHTCPLCAPIEATADALLYEQTRDSWERPIDPAWRPAWVDFTTRWRAIRPRYALPAGPRDLTGAFPIVAVAS